MHFAGEGIARARRNIGHDHIRIHQYLTHLILGAIATHYRHDIDLLHQALLCQFDGMACVPGRIEIVLKPVEIQVLPDHPFGEAGAEVAAGFWIDDKTDSLLFQTFGIEGVKIANLMDLITRSRPSGSGPGF